MNTKESVFRRIDRDEYRREVMRYFPDKHIKYPKNFWWVIYLVFVPPIYGLLLSSLRDKDEARFEAIIGWADPWLIDWAKMHVPSINKVSANLADYGYDDLIPLAQHVYSVSILFSAIFIMISFFYAWSIRATPIRQKRWAIKYCNDRGLNYKKFALLELAGVLMCLLGWWFLVFQGFLDDGRISYLPQSSLLFNRTNWASFWILFIACGSACLAGAIIIITYYSLKRWYVNIRQQIKIKRQDSVFLSVK